MNPIDVSKLAFHSEADKARFQKLTTSEQHKLIRRAQNKPRTGLLERIAAAKTEDDLDAIADRIDEATHMSAKTRRKVTDALKKKAKELEE